MGHLTCRGTDELVLTDCSPDMLNSDIKILWIILSNTKFYEKPRDLENDRESDKETPELQVDAEIKSSCLAN